jgi:LAO/AO transport system kinase
MRKKNRTADASSTLTAELIARIEEGLRAAARENKIPCAGAYAIAEALHVPKSEVGRIADKLQIRISKCQLGCF